MSDNWKDKPHWVLRFCGAGKWELTGPNGDVKSIDWKFEQFLTVSLEAGNIPRFDMRGMMP